MRIAIQSVITNTDIIKPNPYSNYQKLGWVNEIEGRIVSEVVKTYIKQVINTTEDQLEYDLLPLYNNMDVVDVFVDKKSISKSDLRDLYNSYFTENTAYLEDSYASDSKLIFQTGKAAEIIIIYQKKYSPMSDDATSTYLIVESPYSQLYGLYVEAKIDWYKKDFDSYNNTMDAFNEVFNAFSKWYKDHNPIDSNAKVTKFW